MTEVFTTRSPEETWQLAARLLPRFDGGAVLALHGGLGAGKTTFIQGLAFAMGVAGPVTSPTFALLAEHPAPGRRLVHLDLYRLSSADELLDIGFLDYLAPPNVVAVEWPERAPGVFPPGTFHITFENDADPSCRRVTLEAP